MRPSAATWVASVMTSPAPPSARLPRCTRCQSLGVPSSLEYWHMGDTTTLLRSCSAPSENGAQVRRGRHSAGPGERRGRGGDQLRVAFAQRLVGDTLAARQQAEGEAHRIECQVPRAVLEPFLAGARRRLEPCHHRTAFRLVGGERRRNVPAAGFAERTRQADGILHRELGAGADREVRRVGRVAHQHHVAAGPVRRSTPPETRATPSCW